MLLGLSHRQKGQEMALYQQYPAHIAALQQRTRQLLAANGLEYLVIHSGSRMRQFLDDQDYCFVVNPHFKAWLPLLESPNCWLIVNGDDKPKLLLHHPEDYWQQRPALPPEEVLGHFAVQWLARADDASHWLPPMQQAAFIGDNSELARVLGFASINGDELLQPLHYWRAYKSGYEQDCLRQASRAAIAGHKAAAIAFADGGSEFDIHLAYLAASGHSEAQLPYGNIVGINEHAAVLHYTALAVRAPNPALSLLIDAGASCNGYAADISRTYAATSGLFAELLAGVEQLQQQLVAAVQPGLAFADLHQRCHEGVAALLLQHRLAQGSVESLINQRLTHAFFPHGLGHLLGLQVHDVGGHLVDECGRQQPPAAAHPYLRLTRELAENMVLTIEPGLYFIPELLQRLAAAPASSQVNWPLVDSLRPYGGIRIEDNLLVTATGNSNLTRELWGEQP